MIVGHIMARREARTQRKAQWMIGICYPHEVKTTYIIIEEPIVMEPVQEVVMIQSVLEEIIIEPVKEVILMEPLITYSQEKIDEAETMRKLILLQTTLKRFSKTKVI